MQFNYNCIENEILDIIIINYLKDIMGYQAEEKEKQGNNEVDVIF